MTKKQLGQYYTINNVWLLPQIKKFIKSSGCTVAYDPFAGNGDLLSCSKEYGIDRTIGLDIDETLGWPINDSLKSIPHIDDAIIITNPPYLTNYSAKRKKIIDGIKDYFNEYTDLYQLAIDKILSAQDYAVAIIPETFINSGFFKKVRTRIYSVSILLDNPFRDTESPVCVVCFDNNVCENRDVDFYINDVFTTTLFTIKANSLPSSKKQTIVFNDKNGNLAVRAVDMPNPNKKIRFMNVNELDYDVNKIKHSSRLITIISVKNVTTDINSLANECNKILNRYRANTHDIALSPFKGNTKDGSRRRRLDYKTARAIIELALENLSKQQ